MPELIFEKAHPGRVARAQLPPEAPAADDLPQELLRRKRPALPEVSELQAVRHYTRLSQLNFSIDTHFYPLGSFTMKYNSRASHALPMLPGVLERHPLAPPEPGQGFLH
jgi:glycine dehydrogenase subunit 2